MVVSVPVDYRRHGGFRVCCACNVWLLCLLVIRKESRRRILNTLVAVAVLAAVTSIGGIFLVSQIEGPASNMRNRPGQQPDSWHYWLAHWRFWVFSPALALVWVGVPIWWWVVMNTKRAGILMGGLAGMLSVLLGRTMHLFYWDLKDSAFGPSKEDIDVLGLHRDGSGFVLLFAFYETVLVAIPLAVIAGAIMGWRQRRARSAEHCRNKGNWRH